MRRFFAIALLALAACAAPPAPTPADPGGGAEWVLTHIEGGPSEAPRMPTLRIERERASGFAGCNQYFATAAMAGDALSFSQIGATRMYCEGAPMQMETAYLAALSAVQKAQSLDGQLVLFGRDDQELLRFTPAPRR